MNIVRLFYLENKILFLAPDSYRDCSLSRFNFNFNLNTVNLIINPTDFEKLSGFAFYKLRDLASLRDYFTLRISFDFAQEDKLYIKLCVFVPLWQLLNRKIRRKNVFKIIKSFFFLFYIFGNKNNSVSESFSRNRFVY